METDDFYINQLVNLHEIARRVKPVGKARIVAGIYHRERLMAVGFNQMKSHPLQQRFSDRPSRIFQHAEIAALVQFQRRHPPELLANCEMVISRARKTVERHWQFGLVRPCCGCFRALTHFSVRSVTYSLNGNLPTYETKELR